MRSIISTTSLFVTLCILALLSLTESGFAADLTQNTSEGSGQSWTNVFWRTNGVGTQVGPPVPGNTYQMVPNTIPFGNNLGNARIRNPVANSSLLETFPGDSLTLNTNTEIRTKNLTTGVTGVPILNFPGVGGNPGLILRGGVLNVGDDGVPNFTGRVQVATTSFICPGDNGAGTTARAARAVTISGNLSGSGSLVILQTPTNLAQTISGISNTFNGQWFIKAGRLLGTTPDSLGTNSVTVDPLMLPPPPLDATVAATNGWFNGPAVFEPGYTLNSAGVLTLMNGGILRLHQEVVFASVVIEGAPLSPGIHYFPELVSNFPNNFDPGGSGALVVQPYGTPPPLPPSIVTQPKSTIVYTNGNARFSVVAADNGFPPLTYQWRRAGTNLSNGGNISGANTNILVLNNVADGDAAAGYDVIVANASFPLTSSVVSLTLTGTNGEAYESAVVSAGPVAFYQLNETGDPATNQSPAFDFVNGYIGTYGNTVLNGNPNYNIAGPQATSGFPGFASGNLAAQFGNASGNSKITLLPWNLNTNTVTITAWVNPSGPQPNNVGLVFCRGANTVAGLNYSSSGYLGYNWNNEQPTFGWNSGLIPPAGQWSLVAVVVSPTNATIYMLNSSGLASAPHPYNHIVLPFDSSALIGDDSGDGGNGARGFAGTIDGVAIFNKALSQSQLLALYSAGSGVANFPPAIGVQPVSTNLYQRQTAQFTAEAIGTAPLTYQWQAGVSGSGVYTNLTDGGQFSGTAGARLTVANLDLQNAADYIAVVTNLYGSVTSSIATLTVLNTNPAENITMSVQQAANSDWDIAVAPNNWSDNLPASTSAAAKPGSTYELLPTTATNFAARLRTPLNPVIATFPGDVLTVDGDGVWNVNPPTNSTIAEIRFKQPTYGTVSGVVNFKKLVLEGGQLDAGNDGILIIGGRIDVQGTNKIAGGLINNDAGTDRGYRIDAQLTGTGTIEYHGYNQTAFQPTYTNDLNITCTSNTFSGAWNAVTGVLLGTGTNALGTNTIIIGTNAALETTYNLVNSNAYLVLNGKMFLHQNDIFRSALINGVSLTGPSNYTFATLNTLFPTNFPATWAPKAGAANFSTGSGSLIVLSNAGPFITSQPQSLTLYGQQNAQFRVSAIGNLPLAYQWRAGVIGSGVYTNLGDAGNVSGSTNATLNITNITAANGLDYLVVVTNIYGAVTSKVATLNIRPQPLITLQPVSQTLYEQQTAHFNVSTLGLTPLVNQWQAGAVGTGIYTNLTDGGKFSGTTTTNLTVANIGQENAADYIFIVSNAGGSVTSAVATLTVLPISPAENITMSVQQPQNSDWNTGTDWSDGLPASTSAVSKPGSTYTVLTGARLRTPAGAASAVFPGIVLTNNGSGIFTNNNDSSIGEIRFKHANPGTVSFSRLVMNGGQIDNADNGTLVIQGEIDILANTPIYVDSAAGNDRVYQIDAWLTGNGSIEYHDFDSTFNSVGGLTITSTSNTFSGTWHVVQGALIGAGTNSLGTNSITVDAGGALETLYNINSPSANLILNGKMFLHQNDVFRSALIGSSGLAPGTYSFAQLNAAYPGNFPASWPQQAISSFSTGSGSLTVSGPPPGILLVQNGGATLTLTWSPGTLLEATNVEGPWVTNNATSPYVVTPTEARKFFRLQLQ
jgi:hypothetical protein